MISTNNTLGCLPKAIARNLFIGTAVLILSIILGGPKIYISLNAAIISFCLLLLPYIAITWWSIWALAHGKKSQSLVTSGPYALARNPMYAAIIFILNPALGILFRSWFLLFAVIPVYFSWRACVRNEESDLVLKFGAAYNDYAKNTPRFWPNLRRLNPFLFYGTAGILIFLFSFIFLNSSALYLRWVVFETHGEIVYDKPAVTPSVSEPIQFQPFPVSEPQERADYNPSDNAVIISRLNIHAPLVSSVSGTSQKELNEGLNQGVILYPGSARPNQNGEVVLSGHSSIYPWVKTEYGQIFTLLDKLQAGDIVSLVYDHQQYDYRVTGQEVLNPGQVRISETDEQAIKLVTCWPIGTAAKRLVVYGELIK